MMCKIPPRWRKIAKFFFKSSRPSPGMLGAPPRFGGRRVGSVLGPSKMDTCSLSTLELKVLGWDGGRCAKFPLGGEKIQSFLGQVEASNLSLRFDSWSLDVGFQFWTLTFHFWRLLRALEFQLWGLEFELWRLEFAFWELELESWISRAEVGILNCSVDQSRRTLEVLKFASPKLTFWNLQRWVWKSKVRIANCSVYQSRRTLEVLTFASPNLTSWNLQLWIWNSKSELWNCSVYQSRRTLGVSKSASFEIRKF